MAERHARPAGPEPIIQVSYLGFVMLLFNAYQVGANCDDPMQQEKEGHFFREAKGLQVTSARAKRELKAREPRMSASVLASCVPKNT